MGAVTEQLTAAAGQGSKSNISAWVSQLSQDREAWLAQLRANATGEEPMHPVDVFTGIEHLIDDDTFIVLDGGDYVQWGPVLLPRPQAGPLLRLGPLSHLGGGLPYGMAAKLAHPESKVLVFCGDGSFGFYPMEYDTCIRHNLPITTVMGNDATWGIDKTFQVAYYGRAVGTDCVSSVTTRWSRPSAATRNTWRNRRRWPRRWSGPLTRAGRRW